VTVQESGTGNPRNVILQDAAVSGMRFYRLRATLP
jgi:hypothetical protein